MQYIKSILLTAIAPIVWGSTYIVTTEMRLLNAFSGVNDPCAACGNHTCVI